MVGDILQVAPAAPTARPFSSLMIYRHLHLIMIYPQLQELMTLSVIFISGPIIVISMTGLGMMTAPLVRMGLVGDYIGSFG